MQWENFKKDDMKNLRRSKMSQSGNFYAVKKNRIGAMQMCKKYPMATLPNEFISYQWLFYNIWIWRRHSRSNGEREEKNHSRKICLSERPVSHSAVAATSGVTCTIFIHLFLTCSQNEFWRLNQTYKCINTRQTRFPFSINIVAPLRCGQICLFMAIACVTWIFFSLSVSLIRLRKLSYLKI